MQVSTLSSQAKSPVLTLVVSYDPLSIPLSNLVRDNQHQALWQCGSESQLAPRDMGAVLGMGTVFQRQNV